ncbi:MAG: hypothetical protein CM15mP47_0070 [Methanobacteriota archaeon]|nr:MAG: hypothetical protein CM15mP47_0070 [Euryarchaeota archaeon]
MDIEEVEIILQNLNFTKYHRNAGFLGFKKRLGWPPDSRQTLKSFMKMLAKMYAMFVQMTVLWGKKTVCFQILMNSALIESIV